jgi:uncharacterized protein YfiM (DUF2279 family)
MKKFLFAVLVLCACNSFAIESMLKSDKALHLGAGYGVAWISGFIIPKDSPRAFRFGVKVFNSFQSGLLKEHIDDVYRHRAWSWKDVLATTVGGTIQATITF